MDEFFHALEDLGVKKTSGDGNEHEIPWQDILESLVPDWQDVLVEQLDSSKIKLMAKLITTIVPPAGLAITAVGLVFQSVSKRKNKGIVTERQQVFSCRR